MMKHIQKLQQELKDCHQISSMALARSRPGPRIRGCDAHIEPAFMEDTGSKFSACNLHFMDGFKDSISSGASYYDWMKRWLQKPFVKHNALPICAPCASCTAVLSPMLQSQLRPVSTRVAFARSSLAAEFPDMRFLNTIGVPRDITFKAHLLSSNGTLADADHPLGYTFTTGCIPATPASHKPRPPPAPPGPPPPIPPHAPEVTDIENATKTALVLAALREEGRHKDRRKRTEFDDATQPGGLDHLRMAFERHAPHQGNCILGGTTAREWSEDLLRLQLYHPAEQVLEDCGLTGLLPPTRVTTLTANLPGTGVLARMRGLLSETSCAYPLSELVPATSNKDHSWFTLQDSLRSEEVVKAALVDFLLAVEKRGPQDVQITQDGHLKLSPTVRFFKDGINSLFLPGSHQWRTNTAGKGFFTPLDYRCHVEGHAIDKEFPPKMQGCLKRLASMDQEAVVKRYGFTAEIFGAGARISEAAAAGVIRRARLLLDVGFEEALSSSQIKTKLATDRGSPGDQIPDAPHCGGVERYPASELYARKNAPSSAAMTRGRTSITHATKEMSETMEGSGLDATASAHGFPGASSAGIALPVRHGFADMENGQETAHVLLDVQSNASVRKKRRFIPAE